MRSVTYGVAVLAAVGIMFAIARMPNKETSPDQTGSEASTVIQPASSVQQAAARVMEEAGSLTLHVPEMHCPFGCYPAIKKTLESSEAVQEVQLAEQKVEGAIDNPQVIINFTKGFNVDAAIAALKAKGFDNSSVVQ